MVDVVKIHNGLFTRFRDMGDGTFAEVISSSGGSGGSSSDRELVVSTYRCKTAFTGASVGDTITSTQVIDVSGAPTTTSTIWRNQTTAADLVSAPNVINLELVGAQALTDAQLRAAPLPLPSGASTSALQSTANNSLANIDSDLGTPADASATTDTGTFSLISLVKRGLTNWTTLLTRVPALVGGRLPVDGSAVTQPISSANLSSIDTKIPSQSISGLLPVDNLAVLGVSRQLAAGTSSTNTALTTTCRRISISARLSDIRFVVGTGAQTASSTSHFIASGERLDFDVPANSQIAVIRAGTTDAVLELSELI